VARYADSLLKVKGKAGYMQDYFTRMQKTQTTTFGFGLDIKYLSTAFSAWVSGSA